MASKRQLFDPKLMKKIFTSFFLVLTHCMCWGQTFYANSIPSLPSPQHNIAGRVDTQPFFLFSTQQSKNQEAIDFFNIENTSPDFLFKNKLESLTGANNSSNSKFPRSSFASNIQGLQFIESSPFRSK